MAIEALNSSPHDFPRRYDDVEPGGAGPWPAKSKRPRRAADSPEDEYLAVCLVMLAHSAAAADESPASSPPSPPPPPAADISYRCGVCDKAFPSYQALGGHKASHRAKPPIAAAPSFSAAAALSPSGRVHECSVCHRAFPTGQALGGHKRRHYEGVIGGGAKSRTGGGRNIDLNLPPSPELKCDEEVESALPPHSYN